MTTTKKKVTTAATSWILMANRKQKIRGNNKRFKLVERWVEANKILDVNYLSHSKNNYCKVRVNPWGTRISLTKSSFSEPNGKLKQEIIKGLITIYVHWKKQLEELQKPYYLKIWLCLPHISSSQVVCAIDEKLHFYSKTFHSPNESKTLDLTIFESLREEMKNFNWEHHIEEELIFGSELDEETDPEHLKHLKNMKRKAQRIYELDGVNEPVYCVKIGDVWLGAL